MQMSIIHINSEYHVRIPNTQNPLTEEIKLKIFGSPDYPVFLDSLLSYGDSVYSHGTLLEILGTPEKTYLTCMGTPVKTCWKFWQSGRAASAGAAARHSQHARAHTASSPKIISVQAKPKFRKCELSRLNPNVKKTENRDFGTISARLRKSGWAGSTRILVENELSQLNSNFEKNYLKSDLHRLWNQRSAWRLMDDIYAYTRDNEYTHIYYW